MATAKNVTPKPDPVDPADFVPHELTLSQVARKAHAGQMAKDDATLDAELLSRGYLPSEVRREMLAIDDPNLKNLDEVAKEVKDGKWGNEYERAERLAKAGFSPQAVEVELQHLES